MLNNKRKYVIHEIINNTPWTLHSTNKELLVVREDNLDPYENCPFSVIAPLLWNNLPDQIRSAACLSSFKSKANTFSLSHSFLAFKHLRFIPKLTNIKLIM